MPRLALRLTVAIAFVAAGLASAAPEAGAQAGASWTTPGGTLAGTRYSTLTDITPANVGSLVEEFSVATGTKASHEGGPLVVGGTMYVVTPFPNNLIAINLNTPGTILWTFSPGASSFARGVACCDVVNRGASYANGLVVYSVLDDTVVAVNAKTGALVWRTRVGSPQVGETLTGAPIIVKGKVIIGNAGGELGVRGWVQALDLATGAPVWKAYSTGPDADVLIDSRFQPFYSKDQGSGLGVGTWPAASPPNRASWQQGGATSWGWLTYDPATNLLFYGTSNPGVWNPNMRPGDNKWSSTIFARNPDDGHAVWAYQLTPHDGWDFDAINESIVADLRIGGTTRQVIVHFNKNGFAYTIDRTNGQVLVAKNFGNDPASVTWSSGVDLTTGLPLDVIADPPEGVITPGICPSPLGVKDWEPAAYSPATRLFYVPAINFCDGIEPLKTFYIAGSPFLGASIGFAPGPHGTGANGFLGELVAWNAATGKRAWSVHEALPVYSGVLATAGGVVFYGTLNKHFKAVEASNGTVLFDTALECGIVSNPISYRAPDGKQRIAVMTGVGWLAGGFAGGTCPGGGAGGAASTALSDAVSQLPQAAAATAVTTGYVHVFKLP